MRLLERATLLLWLTTRWDRADRLRVVATGVVATVSVIVVLATASVLSISKDDGPYHAAVLQEPGLRRGTAMGMLIFVVLLGVLGAQCARIGAATRDRRLATLRLAGATPRSIRLVVALESALATGVGAIVGAVIFAGLRTRLDATTTAVDTYRRTTPIGPDTIRIQTATGSVHLLPLDSDVSWWVYALATLSLPAVVCVFAMIVLRRVVVTPLGVTRYWQQPVPRRVPAVCGVIGVAILASFTALRSIVGVGDDASAPVATAVIIAAVLTGIGLVAGTASLASTLGSIVARRAQSVALLIGSRRLAQTPWVSSRSSSVSLCVLLVAGFFLGFDAWLSVAAPASENEFYGPTTAFIKVVLAVAVILSLLGVVIASAEAAILARPTVAGLSAAGVARGTLVRALLVQALLPLVAMAPVAVSAGVVAARGILGASDTRSLGSAAHERLVTVSVPVPWEGAFVLVLGSLGAAALLSGLALACVRTDLDLADVRTTG